MYMNRNISRVLAAAVASAGFVAAPMPALGTTLSCASSSFSVSPDGKGNFNVSCNAPGSSATCALSASPSSLPSSGGTVTLTATNCGTVSSVAKNSTQIAQSGTTWTDSIAANTGATSLNFTYTVTGDGGQASVTVTEAAAGTAPPPTGPISCAGYSKTLVYDLPWTAVSKQITAGFNNDAIVVGRFTTSSIAPGSSYPANVSSIEYVDAPAVRTAAISTVPCDLTGIGMSSNSAVLTTGPNWTYQIGGTAPLSRLSTMPSRLVLQPSTTYYINITNRDANGAPTCGTTTCNMILQLTKPTGT